METQLANALFLQNFINDLESLDDRDRHIVVFRLLASDKSTLDEIGSRLGLTRERVRQLEKKLTKELEGPLIQLREIYASELTRKPRPEKFFCMLGEISPFGTRGVEAVNPGTVDFSLLGEKFELYEALEGICFVPSKLEVQQALIALVAKTRSSLLFLTEEVHWGEIQSGPVTEFHLERVLGLMGFERLACGYWLPKGSYVTAAAALLGLEDKPLRLESLRDMIDPAVSLRSLKQRLMNDERFTFPDPNTVRLTNEGERASKPDSIATLISQIVPEDGSFVGFSQVLEFVRSRREVAESSVRAYASRHPYRFEGNRVARSLSGPKRPRQHPSKTRNLYRLPDGWAYRLQVNSEHLRGSSITLPAAFVNAMNLEVDQDLEFQDLVAGETMWVRWDGGQPRARSIRKNLKYLVAKEDSWVVLHFRKHGFEVGVVQSDNLHGPDAIAAMFPHQYGLSRDEFLNQAFMCNQLGRVPLVEAMKLRREFDLVELFEGSSNH